MYRSHWYIVLLCRSIDDEISTKLNWFFVRDNSEERVNNWLISFDMNDRKQQYFKVFENIIQTDTKYGN